MLTVLEVVKKTSEFLASKGVESPRLNAELMVGHALSLPRMRLYIEFERPLSEAELTAVREMVRRRGRREPLQYILGHTDFHGLRLKTDRRALIPRPETELMVELIAGRVAAPPAGILDLGTGSGAIALALAKAFPQARLMAVDSSRDALALARENAEACGVSDRVSFVETAWLEGVPPSQPFDLVVSNPPYLSEAEVAAAAPEVREHEPASALVAPDGGFADLAAIVSGVAGVVSQGGMLALETGIGHHARLTALLAGAGFPKSESLRDLTGRDRFVFAWR